MGLRYREETSVYMSGECDRVALLYGFSRGGVMHRPLNDSPVLVLSSNRRFTRGYCL